MSYVSLGGNCSIAYQLQKYGKRTNSYPFDWADLSIQNLNLVLSTDFDDFINLEIIKLSENHLDKINFQRPSYLIKNNLGIKFAHEIHEPDQIKGFEESLRRRIDRFKQLDSPQFIRIENKKLKSKQYQLYIQQLKDILDKMFAGKYTLTVITHQSISLNLFDQLTHITYDSYSDDWKRDDIDWSSIIM